MNEDRVSEAEGQHLLFWCPGCDGAHRIRYGAEGSPRWTWNGDKVLPTFSPSILVNKGRQNPQGHVCHSYVRNGQIQFLGDCTHALAGKTVDLPAWDRA